MWKKRLETERERESESVLVASKARLVRKYTFIRGRRKEGSERERESLS